MKKTLTLFWGLLLVSFSTMSAQSCPGYKTFTQGGWGQSPSGNNPGTYLNNNFAAVFPAPNYLTIGCNNKLRLTSASAVRAFLPNGTTPFTLPTGTLVNPTKNNYANVFAGQLVALALNLGFDNANANFAPSTGNLKDLVIASGPFVGKTVQFLFDNANLRIGGCSNAFNKTLSEYTTAIDNVNKAYDNGTANTGFLVCPLVVTCSTTNVSCFGGANGSMTAIIAGGKAPFTYSWTAAGVGNVAVANGLSAGTYTVTVTDAVGQVKSSTCTVAQPTQLIASEAHINASCFEVCDGSVTVSATGGTGAYVGTGVYNNLCAGQACYTVSDANGCTAEVCAEITEPAPLSVNVSIVSRVRCSDDANGIASASAVGGTEPYTYAWSNGSIGNIANNLLAGVYYVDVTDAHGCVATSEDLEFDNPTAISLDGVVAEDDDQCGDGICTGSVTISVSGGEQPYQYLWSNGSIGNAVSELCEGEVLSVTISDARGCESVQENIAEISCRLTECGDHKTFTQGGWGASPNGNNPGVYLHANFDAAYPAGLTLGCGDNTLSFYSAQEITDFLPEGGTASTLPTTSVLTGQLLAATLNAGFDAYDANFASSAVLLGDMYTDNAAFAGMTVNEILQAANDVIGGCSDAYALTDLNEVLTTINENFDNGTVDQGHLTCAPVVSGTDRSMTFSSDKSGVEMMEMFPNPCRQATRIFIHANEESTAQLTMFNSMGQVVIAKPVYCTTGSNVVELDVNGFAAQTYVVRVVNGDQVFTSRLIVE